MFLTEFDEDTWRESMKEEGREEGQKESADLINYLWSNGRGEEALKASKDDKYFNKLLTEYRNEMMAGK